MSEERKKLANKIRTSLLIIIYDELNKMKNSNKNILLVNSEESKEYEKKFDNFVIIERESHMSSNKNYQIFFHILLILHYLLIIYF